MRDPVHHSEEFDYVIIGSGAAGSVLAARLSEDPTVTVCVLEAGPADRSPYIHIPAGFIKVIGNPSYTWDFRSEPSPDTAGRAINIPQGRTLGGSSSINGMVYVRGQAADYDHWAQLGNAGWGYADVLPYFIKSETRIGRAEARYRGNDGPLTVNDVRWDDPLTAAFIRSAQDNGLPANADYNGTEQEGVAPYQQMTRRGRRASTAQAFLKPARRRPNLSVRTNARVDRILFDERRAVGVQYLRERGAVQSSIRARREVIISAGSANTARLLQISGVGPTDLLSKIGVETIHNAPGVGANLQDHYSCRVAARVRNATTFNEISRLPRLAIQVARWLLGQQSLLGVSPSIISFFGRSGLSDGVDFQGAFLPASYATGPVRSLEASPGMTATVWQHRPESVGHVHATSTDVFDAPIIQPNYLSAEADQRVLVNAIRFARRLLEHSHLKHFYQTELFPGADTQSDESILAYARQTGSTVFHLSGTAKMGPASDPMAVVGHDLRVHGLGGLRVIDASVMPKLVSGNTCAPTIMIAEKGADLIRQSV